MKTVKVSVKVKTPDTVDYWLVEDAIREALEAVEGFEVEEVKGYQYLPRPVRKKRAIRGSKP